MTFIVPEVDWATALAQFVRNAKEGDVIQVNTEAQAELAKRAMGRMGVEGPAIVVLDRNIEEKRNER